MRKVTDWMHGTPASGREAEERLPGSVAPTPAANRIHLDHDNDRRFRALTYRLRKNSPVAGAEQFWMPDEHCEAFGATAPGCGAFDRY